MENISHLAPILAVRDMKKALTFYNEIGFKTEFLWQDPPSYAVLSGGGSASIHLSLLDPAHRGQKTKGVIYVFVHNVDQLYEECLEKGSSIAEGIATRDYGMRDFEILDPDGNLLTFGTRAELLSK